VGFVVEAITTGGLIDGEDVDIKEAEDQQETMTTITVMRNFNLFLIYSKNVYKDIRDPPSNQNIQSSDSETPARQRNRINQHFPPVSCPYKGWKHYFPSEGINTLRELKYLSNKTYKFP
jgi:hypothetical protein